MRIGSKLASGWKEASLAAVVALSAGAAMAQDQVLGELERVGKPVPGGTGFQPAVTELADDIHWLDNFLLVIISVISAFVLILLAIVILRFNRKSNPTPARFTHNSPLEVAWTLIPILILITIGAFSVPVLFKQLEIPEADMTIKVTGNQWFWTYEYPDDGIVFDSYMLAREDLAANGYHDDEYLLAADTSMVVPINKIVRVQVTGADVIHSWKVPSFGVMMDAMPGRLNETWFKAEREGIYFGQCSELCGKDHAYMPITVKVVSEAAYAKWLEAAKAEYAALPQDPVAGITVAAAD